MNIKEMLARGRQETIHELMTLSSACDPMGKTEEAGALENTVKELRFLADLVEKSPHMVRGLILFSGIDVTGDDEGVQSSLVICGPAPIVAAAHLALEPHGQDAMTHCMPVLLKGALSELNARQEKQS